MDREIKFRRAHFEEATGKFMYFSYWGKFGKRFDFAGAMTVSRPVVTRAKIEMADGEKQTRQRQ